MNNVHQIANNYMNQALNKARASGHKIPNVGSIELSISNRLTKCLGRAVIEPNRTHFKIQINGKAYTCDSTNLKETVYHEVAHILAFLKDGTLAHNHTWRQFMIFLGLSPEVKASAEKLQAIGYKPERRATRNLVGCDSCNLKHTITNSQLLNISSYRCKCKGRLINLHKKVAPGVV